jgi:hypothetical protein
MFYNARYYDPALGRFISADSVVPGSASGSMDGVALKALTVDFHEPGFVSTLNDENQLPFWFQMSNEQKQKAGSPWGPQNPQALNRYSYVQNNPLKYTDPTGHTSVIDIIQVVVVVVVVVSVVLAADIPRQADLLPPLSIDLGMSNSPISDSATVNESRWEERETTSGGTVRVRPLSNKEVRDRGLHREKAKQGYAPDDVLYEDEDGELWAGGKDGPVEPFD